MEYRKNIYTITLLLFFSFSIVAQETINKLFIVDKATKLENEFVGSDIRDDNGNIAACYKIVTDLNNLSFSAGNGIVKMDNSKPGEYYVFVQPGERILNIHATGYAPFKIYTYEVGISKLNKGDVWQVTISGNKKAQKIPVTILSTPSDAIKIIDGEKLEGKTFQLSEGKHKLKIVKDGYKTFETEIDISTKNALFDNIELIALDVVAVFIDSEPKNAKILINGDSKNDTPEALWLFPGEYNIELIKEGFANFKTVMKVTEDGLNRFTYNLDGKQVDLRLNVSPSTAQILINNEDFTGRQEIRLANGLYKLQVNMTGYKPYTENIKITKGETLVKNINLDEYVGSLQFSIIPTEASSTLYKGGVLKSEWSGFKRIKSLPVGSYSIRSKAQGYQNSQKDFVLSQDETKDISIEMDKEMIKEVSQSPSPKPTSTVTSKSKKRIKTKNKSFISYYTQKSTQKGAMIGVTKKVGWYMAYKQTDNTSLSSDYQFSILDRSENEKYPKKSNHSYRILNREVLQRSSFSLGLTFRLHKGFSCYVGLSYGEHTIFQETEEINHYTKKSSSIFEKNIDQSYSGFEHEFGFMYQWKMFHISYGINRDSEKRHTENMLGLGICF